MFGVRTDSTLSSSLGERELRGSDVDGMTNTTFCEGRMSDVRTCSTFNYYFPQWGASRVGCPIIGLTRPSALFNPLLMV